MPTVPLYLVALKPHRYDGRLVRKGQSFEAQSVDDARVLTTIGFAAYAPPEHVPVNATILTDAPVKRPRGRPRKSTYETRAIVETPQTADLVADPDPDPTEPTDE